MSDYMAEVGQEILDDAGFEDWEVYNDAVLIDPDGNMVEWDHPNSPFRHLGLI